MALITARVLYCIVQYSTVVDLLLLDNDRASYLLKNCLVLMVYLIVMEATVYTVLRTLGRKSVLSFCELPFEG